MSTVRATVGQAIVRFMAAQYVERDGVQTRFIAGVWGIFGHGNVAGFGQALEELGDACAMPYYRPQNEQAQVHLAAAFAKHRNRLQAFACTSSIGPGATNMITGAAGATINRLPVLLLPSDYFANRLPDPVLQQIEHPVEHDVSASDAFRPVSRYFDRISRPEQLLSSLPEAFRVLTDPADTGAVTISLPEDVQSEVYDWPEGFFERRVWRIRRPVPEADVVAEVVRLIGAAKRPLIVAGGGAIYAGAEAALDALASRFGIPVCETQAGKGVLPWNHPLNAGPVGANGGLAANRLAREADLVLAVGTRLADFTTASKTIFQDPDVTFVGINVNAFDAVKLRAVPLVADAREALTAIAAGLDAAGHTGTEPAYRERITALKAEWDERVDFHRTPSGETADLAQPEVIGIVNDAVGGHATVVCAAGSLPGDLLKLWRPEDSKAYHLEYGYSCMGYEIPAGLGVKLAEPEREVVVAIGDGTYLMLNSEIVTAVAEGIRITVVLFDNHGYQCIKDLQEGVGVPAFGNELRFRDPERNRLTGGYVPVDFQKHAEAMGALSLFATTEEEIRAAIARAREADRITVITVPVSPEKRAPGYEGWWDVPPAAASGQAGVRSARERYEEALTRQRRELL
ncbi:MAG TPA: 3D-(3,5/4)-trihydroxycyclohexane-1,2-dione acylhydrolase (decyclizing) [Candidatus Limnocylindrales bacterium]|nr:3D-(3,5/4)-trihydroxycyclohexane-1,2-dione acylhydrolase (decyclizing) [Candidatus Limnocylindrales bacterium]